jgi:hypothetical protein
MLTHAKQEMSKPLKKRKRYVEFDGDNNNNNNNNNGTTNGRSPECLCTATIDGHVAQSLQMIEIVERIFSYTSLEDIVYRAMYVSKLWYSITTNDKTSKRIRKWLGLRNDELEYRYMAPEVYHRIFRFCWGGQKTTAHHSLGDYVRAICLMNHVGDLVKMRGYSPGSISYIAYAHEPWFSLLVDFRIHYLARLLSVKRSPREFDIVNGQRVKVPAKYIIFCPNESDIEEFLHKIMAQVDGDTEYDHAKNKWAGWIKSTKTGNILEVLNTKYLVKPLDYRRDSKHYMTYDKLKNYDMVILHREMLHPTWGSSFNIADFREIFKQVRMTVLLNDLVNFTHVKESGGISPFPNDLVSNGSQETRYINWIPQRCKNCQYGLEATKILIQTPKFLEPTPAVESKDGTTQQNTLITIPYRL